jgi:hypothetical protein
MEKLNILTIPKTYNNLNKMMTCQNCPKLVILLPMKPKCNPV